ncbi:MAG TPA: molybdopterin-dependent oxidoreductase [Pirellulaceae bacterium]
MSHSGMNVAEPRLPPNQQLIGDDRWPVVGERAPRKDDQPWTVTVAGLVDRPILLTLDALRDLPTETRIVDIHCVTRWSKFNMAFTGISLATLLRGVTVAPTARFVSFVARSSRGHSTSLTWELVRQVNPLIAWLAGDRQLEEVHGGPVRVVVPGRYFYKSVKWLERIEFLAEDRLGYWEADAGYHNGADPWREERYLAPAITKQEAARWIAARDFSGLDLRSLQASDRALSGLRARDAMLRNADFRRADLRDADFTRANLSNAHFEAADLRGATFLDADIEGANFAGTDLRNCDLRVASMFGASFGSLVTEAPACRRPLVNGATRVDPARWEALSEDQRQLWESLRGQKPPS